MAINFDDVSRAIQRPAPIDTVVYECPKCDAKLALHADGDPADNQREIETFLKTHECRRVPVAPPPYVYDPNCPCSACRAEGLKR